MGALTLKSFPFELRGWDIEKFESLDPTDSFGSNTKVYVSKDQIVLIEPDYNTNTLNTWLTDKGRQFFDGLFGAWNPNLKNDNKLKPGFWTNILKNILETIYILDHCNKQNFKKKFLTIVVENVSIEIINILLILSQNYSFIQLRREENFKVSNDLEKNFQLNIASNKIKLNSSTLCLLISTNPRYEGYYLNLNLRQRFLKGNFKCLSIGSFIDLTFPVTFLGSTTGILKSIAEGNNLICQDLKSSKNPITVFNNELFKRNDHLATKQMLENLNFYTNGTKFNGLNNLSPSLSETGLNITNNFLPLTLKDLNSFSLLYFINTTSNNSANIKKITELNLLNYNYMSKVKPVNNLILDQNYKLNNNYQLTNGLNFSNYLHLPTSVFYENEETFINTEGFIKRTTKLISKKHTRNNWQIIRKILKHLKKKFVSLELKNNNLIFFNSNKIVNFKNYINFNYYATQNLVNLNFYLSIKTTPTVFTNQSSFKPASNKFKKSKLKYWLDDFFTGSKDEYSQNSLVLTNCSKILRSETTNFF